MQNNDFESHPIYEYKPNNSYSIEQNQAFFKSLPEGSQIYIAETTLPEIALAIIPCVPKDSALILSEKIPFEQASSYLKVLPKERAFLIHAATPEASVAHLVAQLPDETFLIIRQDVPTATAISAVQKLRPEVEIYFCEQHAIESLRPIIQAFPAYYTFSPRQNFENDFLAKMLACLPPTVEFSLDQEMTLEEIQLFSAAMAPESVLLIPDLLDKEQAITAAAAVQAHVVVYLPSSISEQIAGKIANSLALGARLIIDARAPDNIYRIVSENINAGRTLLLGSGCSESAAAMYANHVRMNVASTLDYSFALANVKNLITIILDERRAIFRAQLASLLHTQPSEMRSFSLRDMHNVIQFLKLEFGTGSELKKYVDFQLENNNSEEAAEFLDYMIGKYRNDNIYFINDNFESILSRIDPLKILKPRFITTINNIVPNTDGPSEKHYTEIQNAFLQILFDLKEELNPIEYPSITL